MKRTAVPAIKEVISLTEAKAHLRIDVSADDTYISSLITTARLWTERYLSTPLMANTYELAFDKFPRWFDIRNSPLLKIERLSYFTGDVLTDISKTTYDIDNVGISPRITVSNGSSWPTPDTVTNAVRLRYTSGYLLPVLVSAISTANDTITIVNHDFIEHDTVSFHLTGGSGILSTDLTESQTYFVRDVSGDTFKIAETEGGSALDITDAGTNDIYISNSGGLPEPIRHGMLDFIGDMFEKRCTIPRTAQFNTLYETLNPFKVVLLA